MTGEVLFCFDAPQEIDIHAPAGTATRELRLALDALGVDHAGISGYGPLRTKLRAAQAGASDVRSPDLKALGRKFPGVASLKHAGMTR